MDQVKAKVFNINNLASELCGKIQRSLLFSMFLSTINAHLPLHALFLKLFTLKHLSAQYYALTTVLNSVFPAEVPLNHCHLVTTC